MGIDTVEPGAQGGRPIPDKPRGKNKDMKIFALLVGIDDYQGEVPRLGGCLADVTLVGNFLRNKYGKDEEGNEIESVFSPLDGERADEDIQVESLGRLHICSLTDSLATYDNVIRAFEEFLISDSAKADDSFWFHFSGHGTEQYTAEEFYRPEKDGVSFPSLVPNGKDQSLVCYNTNGGTAGALLADKELAVLVANVYDEAAKRRLNKNQKPHIILSIDCCHAGTASRGDDDDFEIRMFRDDAVAGFRDWDEASDEENTRSIESYYKGYYQRQIEEDNSPENLDIPEAPHMLLAGAHSLEKAGDTGAGGFFTKSLIDILSKPKGYNYVDLFNQTRNLVRKLNKKQTPQFEPISNFNPYTRFLEGWEDQGNIGLYPVRSNTSGKSWFIRCGAVNGLPTDAGKEIEVIIRNADTREALGNAFITRVGVQDSRLDLGFALEQEPSSVVVGTDGARGQATGNPRKILRPRIPGARNESANLEETTAPPALVLDADDTTPYVAQLYKVAADSFFIKDLANLRGKLADLTAEERLKIEGFLTDLENFSIYLSNDEAEEAEATIQIKEENGTLTISDLQGELNTYEVDSTLALDKQLDNALASIEKIVRWKRMMALENPVTALKDYFSAELQVASNLGTGVNTEIFETFPFGTIDMIKPPSQFHLNQFEDEEEEELLTEHFLPIRLQLNFTNKKNTENLYFYLFNMHETGMIAHIGQPHFIIENTSLQHTAHYPLVELTSEQSEDQDGSSKFITEIILPDGVEKVDYYFKLLVTKQQIIVEQLEQEGLTGTRGDLGKGGGSSALKHDWCFMTMRFSVEKRMPTVA